MMKLASVVAVIGMAAGASAQANINYKPCEDVIKPYTEAVTNFNADPARKKDGLQISLACLYGNPAPQKRELHVALTPDETRELHQLRETSTTAFDEETKYEEYLIAKHHVRNPKAEENPYCWYFVGIKLDDDFISIDPNTSFADCGKQRLFTTDSKAGKSH